MSDRTGTGATLSIGHKGAIHATALAAGRRSSSFAPPPLRPKCLLSATSRQGRPTLSSKRVAECQIAGSGQVLAMGRSWDADMVTQQVMTCCDATEPCHARMRHNHFGPFVRRNEPVARDWDALDGRGRCHRLHNHAHATSPSFQWDAVIGNIQPARVASEIGFRSLTGRTLPLHQLWYES